MVSLIETIAGLAVPQTFIPLRLLTSARRAASWLCAHPMPTIALMAAAFGAIEHHQAHKWAGVARERGAAIAAIQNANASAIQQATVAKEAKDVFNTKLAADGDRTAADLRDRYRLAVMQLRAARDRVPRTDLPGHADAPASSDRPGESAGVSAKSEAGAGLIEPLVISQNDALTCADNIARLQAVRDWAVALAQ